MAGVMDVWLQHSRRVLVTLAAGEEGS